MSKESINIKEGDIFTIKFTGKELVTVVNSISEVVPKKYADPIIDSITAQIKTVIESSETI